MRKPHLALTLAILLEGCHPQTQRKGCWPEIREGASIHGHVLVVVSTAGVYLKNEACPKDYIGVASNPTSDVIFDPVLRQLAHGDFGDVPSVKNRANVDGFVQKEGPEPLLYLHRMEVERPWSPKS